MAIPEGEAARSPIPPARGLAKIDAARGMGKMWIDVGVSYAVATGNSFLRWHARQHRRAVYINWEIPQKTFRDRVNVPTSSGAAMPSPEHLRFLARGAQEICTSCNLADPRDHASIHAERNGAELIVVLIRPHWAVQTPGIVRSLWTRCRRDFFISVVTWCPSS